MSTSNLKVGVVGLGYFSQFHLGGWQNNPRTTVVGVCDTNKALLETVSNSLGISSYTDIEQMITAHDCDVVDIIAPPPAHADLVRAALDEQRVIICQKPFCETRAMAETVASEAAASGCTVVIHENFRFQPWYRTLKTIVDSGALGQIYQCRFNLRPGDGRGAEAYLSRQPSFQKMQRFLIRETGVHFIDVFRWLFGPVTDVYADLRKLNPVIAGEDAGQLILHHESGVTSVFDGNRLVDHTADNHRLTMGEMYVESESGVIRLDGYGQLFQRLYGENRENPIPLDHAVNLESFGGGCVDALINHVVDAKLDGLAYENTIDDYLSVVAIEHATYLSAETGKRIAVEY